MLRSALVSYEIQATRGDSFGQSGGNPISETEWQRVVAHSAIIEENGVTRIGSRPIQFSEGIISIRSPSKAELAALEAIAASLNARLFGEDGSEVGASAHSDVLATLHQAFPDLDTSVLTAAIARDLVDVTDPTLPAEQLREALVRCRRLEGDLARTAFAYLLCRAVECAGTPAPTLTCLAAYLYPVQPALVDPFRAEPTASWVVELEQLAGQLQKKPGNYVIRPCHRCAAKNRIALFPPAGHHPRCGACKTPLAALE